MRLLLLILWASLTFFIGLGAYSLYIVDEARNAQAAWEMYENQEWVVPTFNGHLRSDKPPLHYYGMRLAYSLLGKNAWAARLVSALLGLGLTVILFRVARQEIGATSAPWAVATLLASLYFPLQMRLATPDPYLIFFFTLAMLGFWTQWRNERSSTSLVIGTYLALGLAALAKGPVAVGLAGLSIIVFLLWERQLSWSSLARLKPISGLLVGLLVTLPWLWAVHIQSDGAWTRGFFLEHNLERFSAVKEGHGGGFWLIPLLALVSLCPFSLVIPTAISSRKDWSRDTRSFLRFCLSIIIVILGFFMLSRTKLPSYPAPAYPFIALVLAPTLSKLANKKLTLPLWIAISWSILSLAIPIAAYWGIDALKVSLSGWQAIYLLPLPILVVSGSIWYYQRQAAQGLWSIALGFGSLSLILFTYFFPRIDTQNHVQESLPLLQGQEVVVYQRCTPSYIYYVPGPLPVFQELSSLQQHLQQARESCPLILSTHHSEADLDQVDGLQEVFRQRDLFENLTTILYRYETESCL